MNTTKKADRETWIARAAELIVVDDDTRVINRQFVIDTLISEFGISLGSAQTAIARAAMRSRNRRWRWTWTD